MSSLSTAYRQLTLPPRNPIYQSFTPSDSNATPESTILIGLNGDAVAGDIALEWDLPGGTTASFTLKNAQPGASFPVSPTRIMATGTTATSVFVGLA